MKSLKELMPTYPHRESAFICPYCGWPRTEVQVNYRSKPQWVLLDCTCVGARRDKERAEEQKWKDYQLELKKERALDKFMKTIPEMFHLVEPSDTLRSSHRRWLWISGQVGVGKTHLACAVGLRAAHDGLSVKFTTDIDLLLEIKSTFNQKSTRSEQRVREENVQVDLLIIDDLGKAKPTEWALEQLFAIIDARYAQKKFTVFTSQFDENELLERWPDRDTALAILSRMKTAERIYLEGSDRRC